MKQNEYPISTWQDFKSFVNDYPKNLINEGLYKGHNRAMLKPIFRGHGSSKWKLESTLQRRTNKPEFDVEKYIINIKKIHKIIQSNTNRFQDLSDSSFDKWLNMKVVDNNLGGIVLNYMIYLRHYGYPSPLIDWTGSPYVAAFFAFQEHIKDEEDSVAIYACMRSFTPMAKSDECAKTHLIGHNIKTDTRHFLQQSHYTFSTITRGERLKFTGYTQVHDFEIQDLGPSEHAVTKVILPKSERETALKDLELMNINSYSIFGDEESLVKTLGLKCFELNYFTDYLH